MSETKSGFLRADGTDFALDGQRLVLRGFGLGNWLNLEHFMLGLPGTEAQIRGAVRSAYGAERAAVFWDKYRECYLNEDDFALLSELGVNSLRIPLNYRLFEDDRAPFEYDETGFVHLDRVLGLCERHHILAILDLHSAPGGQNPDWHSDNAIGEPQFWEHPHFQERVIRLWQFLADRYQSHTEIGAYDLLNEPCLNAPAGGQVAAFFDQLVRAVREVDQNHLLFVEGDFYARDFSAFAPSEDHNLAYTFHYYPFIAQMHNPELSSESGLREDLRRTISLDFIRDQLARPVWCGETGAPLAGPDRGEHELLLGQLVELFEREGISWSLWCYKDARSLGAVHPAADSPWMTFSRQASAGWNFWEEFQRAEVEAEQLEAALGTRLGTPERRRLQFRRLADQQIVLAARLTELLRRTPFDELLSYPESFRLGACERWAAVLELVRKYTR